MTTPLFQDDSYLNSFEAKVTGINERGGIVLDQSGFYPTGGGQPGDSGSLLLSNGSRIAIATTVKGDTPGEIVLVPTEPVSGLSVGETVTGEIDWPRRLRLMRMHTALHLLSVVLPYPVTGGQISDKDGRLDFDIPDGGLDKDEINDKIRGFVDGDHKVTIEWITDDELDANPGLVKTMRVQPPRGSGRVRLVRIGEIDLQPCGGTHVRTTGEIGMVGVTKIEKKGRQNRRVRIALQD